MIGGALAIKINKFILYCARLALSLHRKIQIIMEEFGEWIYILFIIIAVISSVISSMRKKAQQAAEKNRPREIITTSNSEDDFWDVPTPQQEIPPKPMIRVKPKREVQFAHSSFEKQNKPYFDIHQEGVSALNWENPETVATIDEEYETVTVDELQNNPDEWRKAFIYNEIFNRRN